METSAPLEAEASMDSAQQLRLLSPTEERDHLGETSMLVAKGGFMRDTDPDEETPLLSRDNDDTPPTYTARSGDGAGGDEEPEWDGWREFEGLPWYKTPSIYWLLPFFLLFTLAFGGALVPKLNLIKRLVCRDYYAEKSISPTGFYSLPKALGIEDSDDPCREDPVQRGAAKFQVISSLIAGILSAITTPKIGALSDRYGRTRVMGITACGSLLTEIFSLLAATYPDTFNVNWMYVAYAVDGLSGSFTAGMALGHGYATDCTHPSKRNVAFGYFSGCLFVGIAIGPVLGGLLVNATGSLRVVFVIALAFHLLFITAILFIIPESLTKKRQLAARDKYRRQMQQRRFSWLSRANVFEPLKVLWPTGPGSSPQLRRNLVLIAGVDSVMFGAAVGSVTVVVYYLNSQFGWHDLEQSIYVSTVNVFRVATLFLVLPVTNRIFRGPASTRWNSSQRGCDSLDLGIIRFATLIDIAGHIGYIFVRSGELFIVAGCIAALGGMGSPTLSSSLTKHVPRHQVGQLLGATGLLHALTRVVAPPMFNAIWFGTIGHYKQTIFVVQTSVFAVAAIMTWFVKAGVSAEHEERVAQTDEGSAETHESQRES